MRKNLPGHGEITGNRAGSTGSGKPDFKDCLRKVFQKYPVDEAFMGWIETKYGSGVLQSLYTQLENGNQDPDLWYRFTGNSMHVLWLMYCRQQQYMSYSYEDVIWKEASDPACIRLDFVGDICLDENWCTGKTAKNHMADYFPMKQKGTDFGRFYDGKQ